MAVTLPKDSDGVRYVGEVDGSRVIVPTRPAPRNTPLLTDQIVVWNGSIVNATVNVPVGGGTAVAIRIEHDGDVRLLTVTFEFETSAGKWLRWHDSSGVEVSMMVAGSGVYGPIGFFPRYLRGRLRLTASSPPPNGSSTIVQVQEVE